MDTKRALRIVDWALLLIGALAAIPWLAAGLAGWGLTAGPDSDEWIELHNPAARPVDLGGWSLSDGADLSVVLTGTIPANGYFLLERGSDATVQGIPADQIFQGKLENTGEALTLRDTAGTVVDTANRGSGPWPAGSAGPDYRSMERVDPGLPDDPANWASNDAVHSLGYGALGDPVHGTPKLRNSASTLAADLYIWQTVPAGAAAGDQIDYTIEFGNRGNLAATQTTISAVLPAGLVFGQQSSPYSYHTQADGTVVWEIGTLPYTVTTFAIEFSGRVTSTASAELVSRVRIASAAPEVTTANDVAVAATALRGPFPDLLATQSGPDRVRAGDLVTYTIAIKNIGPSAAPAVRVTDTLPAGVGFVSQASPYTFTLVDANTLTWAGGELSPTVEARITVTGRVALDAAGWLSNTVAATTPYTEVNRANSTATLATAVGPARVVINEVAWAMDKSPAPALVLLIGLGIPLILGLPLLQRARQWLAGHPQRLATGFLILGGLWVLAGPLSTLNFLYGRVFLPPGSATPLALALVGTVPPLLGLAFLGQAVAAWPEGRARLRQTGGWIYLAGAALQAVLGVVAFVQGNNLLLLGWFTQAALLVLMAASLFEQRTQAMGAFFIALGLVTGLLFIPAIQPDQVSTFVLNPPEGMVAVTIGDVGLPSGLTVAVLASFMAGLGIWQAVRQRRWLRIGIGGLMGTLAIVFLVLLGMSYGLTTTLFLLVLLVLTLGLSAWQILRTRETNGVLGAIIFLFLVAFLIWAARGQAFNFTGMLIGTLEAATPIALGALSGVWCERSAVINIAIEGMMLSAAFTAVVISSATDSLLMGLLAGVLTGALLAALLAVLSIRFKVNQIIAGTAINILATGVTSFLSAQILAKNQHLNSGEIFPRTALPGLAHIPVIGPVFFQSNMVIYLMLLLVVITHIVLFHTRWGLRSRSVGEHPLAADTLGVNVFRTRYLNVIIGGLIAGLGGVYFTMASVNRFDEVMTAGRGFIGLAAMIFGRWTPVGGFGSSLIFGFASSLQMKMGLLNVPIPSHFLLMAPYLATIIILAGVVGRAVAPAADGEVYEKN